MTEEFSLDEGDNPLIVLFQQLTFEDNLSKKLVAIDLLLGGVDDATAKKVGSVAFKRYLRRNYLADMVFIRKLRLYSKILETPETAIAYLGTDFDSHPEFIYDEKFEKSAKKLELMINNFVGRLLKHYTKSEIITF